MIELSLSPLTRQLLTRVSLNEEQAFAAFQAILSGELDPIQVGAFLTALSAKGETVNELMGAVRALREQAQPFHAPENALDTCGTGGDFAATYNISTAAAFVLAGCGVAVAKHGNRAITSASGSSDVLAALGVTIDASPPLMERALAQSRMAFMLAPLYYPAMRHVAEVRKALGFRTIFNLIGPLANPARAPYQLVGVYDAKWLDPFATVLQRLGTRRAWIVHGRDGLDELTTTDATDIAELTEDGAIRHFTLTPEDFGLPRAKPEDLRGGDAIANAHALRELLAGKSSPYRDIVLLNAAAALVIVGKAGDVKEGMAIAAEAIDNRKAQLALERLIAATAREEA